MLYMIGLGLGNEKDITLRGLDAIRNSTKIYLESYTSLLGVDKESLEKLYEKEIIIADREFVEEKVDKMLEYSETENVSFLVVGDVFGATTHSDLYVRAAQKNIKVSVIHNASIMNAAACCGLQLYKFGETISQVLWTDDWKPDSYYEKIKENRQRGLHTLCLLDIKVKEPTLESLARGKKVYEPSRFMTINDAVLQLLEVEENHGGNVYDESTFCVGIARCGQDDQKIAFGTMEQLRSHDFGKPLHSLIIPGDLHFLEREMLDIFKI